MNRAGAAIRMHRRSRDLTGISGFWQRWPRTRGSHHPRHAQQAGPLGVGGFDRLLGAEHDHPALGGDLCHSIAEAAQIGGGGGKDFLAHALACRVGVADQVALHRREALGIGQTVGINFPDGADDIAFKLRRAEIRGFEELRGAVVDVERRGEVGVAIGYEREIAGVAVEIALAPIGAALDADLLPQVGGA